MTQRRYRVREKDELVPFYRGDLVTSNSNRHSYIELFTASHPPLENYAQLKFNGDPPIYWYIIFAHSDEQLSNTPFTDDMKIVGVHKSRFVVQSLKSKKPYTITMGDMLEIMNNDLLDNSIISGTWKFVKHGFWGIKCIH